LQRTSIGRKPKLDVTGGRFQVEGEALQRDGSLQRRTFVLTPFAQAKDYRVWLNQGPANKQWPVSLATGSREILSSRDEQHHAALTDGNLIADRRSKPRADDGFDFFGVEFDEPTTVGLVRFHQGTVTTEGGWFAGKPVVEVQRAARGPWESVATLDAYPAVKTDVKTGAAYEVRLKQPELVKALRVRGRRGGAFTSCTELELLP
jgi:hypothetical protein